MARYSLAMPANRHGKDTPGRKGGQFASGGLPEQVEADELMNYELVLLTGAYASIARDRLAG